MPTPQSPPTAVPRSLALAAACARALALAAVLFLPVAVLAGWLDRLTGPPRQADDTAPRQAAASLEQAVRLVKSLPASADGVALAAEATQEGHWRFVSRAGEVYTAGTPEEMRRAVTVLHPEAKANARLALYVTGASVFHHRSAFRTLPAGADLFVVAESGAYRLLRRADGAAERLYAVVRDNLVTELTDRRAFEEAAWQMERPLARAHVRVLALEPAGPSTLHARPRIDPSSGRAVVDVIDPASLAAAMGAVRGQTLLVVGRVEAGLLLVRPDSGGERSLLLKDLFAAARDAEVNLIVLQAAATPRQPGGRNWLWQRVEVRGLDQALERARMADFLSALGASNRGFAAAALPLGNRTVLDLTASAGVPGGLPKGQAGDLFAGLLDGIAGKVAISAVLANLQSAQRERELQRRLIPGIPSGVQIGYLLLLLAGLVGFPASRIWWQGIWPSEARSDYAGRPGYLAARAARALAFALVFVPLTAPVAAPCSLARQVRDAALTPVRLFRSLRGRSGLAGLVSRRTAHDNARG